MYLRFPIVKELVCNYFFSRQNSSTIDTKTSEVLYIKAFGIIKVLHKLEREILYFTTIPIFFLTITLVLVHLYPITMYHLLVKSHCPFTRKPYLKRLI